MDEIDIVKLMDMADRALDECEMRGYNITVEAIFECPKCHNLIVARRYIIGDNALMRVSCNTCGIDVDNIECDYYQSDDEEDEEDGEFDEEE